MPGWHAVRSYLGCALGLALFAASILATGAWAERNQLTAIRERGAARLDLQAALLEQELSRYHYLPAAVRLNPDVLRLLAQPEDGALAAKVDRFLEALNQEAGASDLYVLNRDGKVLAASNWNQKTSFVGVDLSYRPYFQDALRTGVGRIYGIGTTTGEPGYYFAQAVDVILLRPEERVVDKEGRDLAPPKIVDRGVPVGVEAELGVLMLVERGAIEMGEAVLVDRKVCRHPVDQHRHPGTMRAVDEPGEAIGPAKPR